ncbi:MAG: ORF6N domain-containing protein [Bacteroidetes bacterium]|nr:ORF6N domain-containing protein [Bacteroidota bacterium]
MQLQVIQQKIFEVRGQKVMLDFDLAELYEVETRVLNQAVKRNFDIFPDDFMFQLTVNEWESIRSQIATATKNNSSQFVMSSRKHRGTVYLPFAFTEHGVTMLANVLKSKKARQTSIAIVRAFIALKQFALNYKELADKIDEIEKKYNKKFTDIYEVLRLLLDDKKQRAITESRDRVGFKKGWK